MCTYIDVCTIPFEHRMAETDDYAIFFVAFLIICPIAPPSFRENDKEKVLNGCSVSSLRLRDTSRARITKFEIAILCIRELFETDAISYQTITESPRQSKELIKSKFKTFHLIIKECINSEITARLSPFDGVWCRSRFPFLREELGIVSKVSNDFYTERYVSIRKADKAVEGAKSLIHIADKRVKRVNSLMHVTDKRVEGVNSFTYASNQQSTLDFLLLLTLQDDRLVRSRWKTKERHFIKITDARNCVITQRKSVIYRRFLSCIINVFVAILCAVALVESSLNKKKNYHLNSILMLLEEFYNTPFLGYCVPSASKNDHGNVGLHRTNTKMMSATNKCASSFMNHSSEKVSRFHSTQFKSFFAHRESMPTRLCVSIRLSWKQESFIKLNINDDSKSGSVSSSLWQLILHIWPVNRFFPAALNSSNDDMAYLGYRLATLSALPSSVPVSRVRLAEAGFYFRGHDDEVTCYRCQSRHCGWRAGDNPLSIHRQIAPNCPHVREMDEESSSVAASSSASSHAFPQVGEKPNGRDRNGDRGHQPDFTRHSTSTDACAKDPGRPDPSNKTADVGACGARNQNCVFPTQMLDLGGAVYPMYQDLASRRRSFPSWDELRAPLLEEMVLCGMFYAGYSDCVRCFYCGVGLKSWEVTDDVWTEHIRWRPDCNYLRTVKGDNYIREVMDRIRREAEEPRHHEACSSQRLRSSNNDTANSNSEILVCNKNSNSEILVCNKNSSSGANLSSQLLEKQLAPSSTGSISCTGATPTHTPTTSPNNACDTLPTVSGNECNGKSRENGTSNDPRVPGRENGRCLQNSDVESSAAIGNPAASLLTSSSLEPGNSTETEQANSRRLPRNNYQVARRFKCKVCHQAVISVVILPCGHLATCDACTITITNCPVCNDVIQATAQVHTD